MAGKHNHRYFGSTLLQTAERFQALDPRKYGIQGNNVRTNLIQLFERTFAVFLATLFQPMARCVVQNPVRKQNDLGVSPDSGHIVPFGEHTFPQHVEKNFRF